MAEEHLKPVELADRAAEEGADDARLAERAWWRRLPLLLTKPRSVFVALREDDETDVVARSEPLDSADVGAAAAAEHQRPGRKRRSDGETLLGERRLLDRRRLRVRKRDRRGRGHRLPTSAPGTGNADHARCICRPARVALVPVLECDRSQGAAVWTAGTQPAHDTRFWKITAR